MKLAGVLLVVASCSLFGLNMAAQLKRRTAFLRSLLGLLAAMRNELCGALCPVGEVLPRLGEKREEPAAAFFADCAAAFREESFRMAWISAAQACRSYGLEEEECQNLARLGDVVGRYDAERQQEELLRTERYFSERLEQAGDEQRRQSGVRAALGVGAGLVLAILMI